MDGHTAAYTSGTMTDGLIDHDDPACTQTGFDVATAEIALARQSHITYARSTGDP